MATVTIREYKNVAIAGHGLAQIAEEGDNTVDQAAITLSGASQQSAAFAAGTCMIAISSTGIFSYKVGANPAVTTGMLRFPADTVLFIGVQPGDKVAVITNT